MSASVKPTPDEPTDDAKNWQEKHKAYLSEAQNKAHAYSHASHAVILRQDVEPFASSAAIAAPALRWIKGKVDENLGGRGRLRFGVPRPFRPTSAWRWRALDNE
jgi:hypothetical protein